jgi:hypothetical protein
MAGMGITILVSLHSHVEENKVFVVCHDDPATGGEREEWT